MVARGRSGGNEELVFDGSFRIEGEKELWRWMVVMGTQHCECTNTTEL